jgi:hypothetical protein
LALPAAGLLQAQLLSSSMHRRPLTWKKYTFNREEVQSRWSPHFRDHKSDCMHITGITCHISNNYRESGIKDKVPNNTRVTIFRSLKMRTL